MSSTANVARGGAGASVLRVTMSVLIFAGTCAFLVFGFLLLRSTELSKVVTTVIAIVWGVGGTVLLYGSINYLIETLPAKHYRRAVPFLFVGPAVLIMGWYLALPTARTLYLSFFDRVGAKFVGLSNYAYVFTDRVMRGALLNNLLWMVFGTLFCLTIGFLVALLVDRSRHERLAKSLIFMPMAISFVGAGVIWKFIYAFRPAGEAQIGLLNAIVGFFGGDPLNWIILKPFNTFLLIAILVWLQTGYAMVILSAAIKGIPEALLEAARIDGASEVRITFQMILPCIKSTIITVGTTILLMTLKIFDIVYSMTNGLYGTEVLASQQYKQMFKFLNYGRGAAIAIVILLVVVPIIYYNVRQFSSRRVFR